MTKVTFMRIHRARSQPRADRFSRQQHHLWVDYRECFWRDTNIDDLQTSHLSLCCRLHQADLGITKSDSERSSDCRAEWHAMISIQSRGCINRDHRHAAGIDHLDYLSHQALHWRT